MKIQSVTNITSIHKKKYPTYTIKLSIPIYWIRQGESFGLITNAIGQSLKSLEHYFNNPKNQVEIENGIKSGKYQRADISNSGCKRFDICKVKFEQYIKDVPYESYKVWRCGTVYVINKSIIIYTSIKVENQEQFVIEEIFSDSSLDLNLKQMQKTDSMIEYWHFSGLGFCTPYRISNYLLINDIFPQFQIDTLYDKWIGNPITFAAFKIQEDNYIGYAISHTNARQTIKKILDIGSDIVFSCLNCPKKADIMHSTGLKYSISLDKNMYKAIMGRFQGKYDISWRKQNLGGGRIGIEEKGMLFCWLTVYAKGFSNNFEEKVLLDLQNELYNDVDWYEYTIPENKWKSEQLVYELVKQLYPNKSVFYQYRPDFLRFGNRQLSYDIYIPSEKIAFEYQGRQHFEPVDFFGGEEHYKKQVERDELKRKSSKEAGILLVYINYWDDLNIELLKKRIMEAHQKI